MKTSRSKDKWILVTSTWDVLVLQQLGRKINTMNNEIQLKEHNIHNKKKELQNMKATGQSLSPDGVNYLSSREYLLLAKAHI